MQRKDTGVQHRQHEDRGQVILPISSEGRQAHIFNACRRRNRALSNGTLINSRTRRCPGWLQRLISDSPKRRRGRRCGARPAAPEAIPRQ